MYDQDNIGEPIEQVDGQVVEQTITEPNDDINIPVAKKKPTAWIVVFILSIILFALGFSYVIPRVSGLMDLGTATVFAIGGILLIPGCVLLVLSTIKLVKKTGNKKILLLAAILVIAAIAIKMIPWTVEYYDFHSENSRNRYLPEAIEISDSVKENFSDRLNNVEGLIKTNTTDLSDEGCRESSTQGGIISYVDLSATCAVTAEISYNFQSQAQAIALLDEIDRISLSVMESYWNEDFQFRSSTRAVEGEDGYSKSESQLGVSYKENYLNIISRYGGLKHEYDRFVKLRHGNTPSSLETEYRSPQASWSCSYDNGSCEYFKQHPFDKWTVTVGISDLTSEYPPLSIRVTVDYFHQSVR
ncbi:hypothetical protein FACS189431_5340 [Alphaproteobacteria bacterium]|nr:hypothetical protein FACS189431_5340 [Alphaproteobacteria bacterium]